MHHVGSVLGFTRGAFIASVVASIWLAGQAGEVPPAPPVKDLGDISLQELLKIPIPKVYGASKWEQPVTKAPSSVTVITAEEIKRYGHRTLAEVLQSARGLYVSYDRSYSFLGARGFNRGDFNSRVLVLVDGHRLNNNLSDGGAIGTDFLLDVDLIQQVEIVRGPVATLYGNNAFFGIINVITRRGRAQAGVGVEVSGEVASFDTYKGRVTWGHQFKNELELLVSGSLYSSEGARNLFFKEYDFPGSNHGLVNQGDDDDAKSLFGSVRYRDFTLQGGFLTREKGDPTAPDYPLGAPLLDPAYPPGTAFNDDRTRAVDERGYASLSFRRELSDELDLSANLYYDCASLDRDYLYNFPPRVLNRESRQGEWCGAEAQVNWRLWDKHLLTVGGEYRNDFRQDRRNYDVEPYVEYARVHRDTFNYGIYVQGDVAFRTNLHLNAGARYDQYGKLDPTANPRVALIYNPLQASTLKAIYGTAFRAPNFLERIDPRFVDLDPETITTYELAWEQGIGNRWRAALAGFYNQIDDLITLVPGVGYRNLEGAEAKGLEAELEGLLASGLRCRLSYSFQQTEDRATGRTLSDSPEHLGKFNLSVPVLKDKLFASLELQYTSSRLTLAGTTADGFGLVNLTLLSQQLIKGVEASVSLYNVLDQRYGDPATPGHLQEVLERDGRTVRFKLTYRF